ncbi:MAG: VOC family protein [Flavimaricola sp.]|nr:VOC family protein [Flavimaricola sp.]
MKLGAFSISLAVKDLAASAAFYKSLGFEPAGGDMARNYLILRNPDGHLIGLFQGMFDKNMLTFNPGWSQEAQPLDAFEDVRDLQKAIMDQGLTLDTSADPDTTGPAHIMITDPDGNPILIDQHR